MAASTTLIAYRNRTSDYTVTLYQADDVTGVAVAAEDVIRVKIGRGNAATPNLDIDSVAATANGSLCTVTQLTAPAKFNLRLAQGDLSALSPGAMDLEILVVDASDAVDGSAKAIKHAQQGVFHVIGQMSGDIGVS